LERQGSLHYLQGDRTEGGVLIAALEGGVAAAGYAAAVAAVATAVLAAAVASRESNHTHASATS
jgi:hypothetical protein